MSDQTQMCVRLGSGCMFVEESWYEQAFQGMVPARQFRNFMRNLDVRPMQIGRRWFYEHAQVELALTQATMGDMNEDDGVYFPGSLAVKSGYRKSTKLDPDQTRRERRRVREELLARKKIHTGVQMEETRAKVRAASERIPRKSRRQTL